MNARDYFRGRNVIVTGGSSGIGRRLAVRLAEAGASVLLLARRPGPLAEAVAELEARRRSPNQTFRAEPVDLGHREAVEAVIARLLGEFDVDVLINNAAITHADELCDRGVRVTVLLPPDTDTPMLVEENRTKPPQMRAIAGTVRMMDKDDIARALLRGMAAGRYHVVPGVGGKFTCSMTRWLPGVVRWAIDREARSCRVETPVESVP